ncbi:MAG: hypothetical protein V7717_02220 [Porticoccaceae bacterium]
MNREITLSSLAMLKAKINEGGDYLEYLRPFVIQALSLQSEETPISDELISNVVRDVFGLIIPARTTHILLKRIARDEKYLVKRDGVFRITDGIPPSQTIEKEKAQAQRTINSVSKSFIKFASEFYSEELNDEEAFDAITVFLSKFSLSCLKAFLRGTALPNHLEHTDRKLVLVCNFVSDLEGYNNRGFEDFMILVQGHMLANALTCPDLDLSKKSYAGVSFYLDTPLLVQALGLEGEAKHQSLLELVSAIQNLGGEVCYFSHTFEELEKVISGSAEYIDSHIGRGAIVFEARKSGQNRADLLMQLETARESLEVLGLRYLPTPAYNEKYQIDETKLDSIITSLLTYHHNPNAKSYDINSVRSIFALRKGNRPNRIDNCRALMITNNSALADAAYEYGQLIEKAGEISTLLTDFSVANISWLKAPQASPLLPQREIMAFAYATLRPSDEFLGKVLEQAERLEAEGKISPENHQLLRSSNFAQQLLYKATLGEEEGLTEEAISKTLQRVSDAIREKELAKFKAEEEQHLNTRQLLDAEQANTTSVRAGLLKQANTVATRTINLATILLLVVIILGNTAGWVFDGAIGLQKFIWISTAIGAAIASIFALYTGLSIKEIRNRLIKQYRTHLYLKKTTDLGLTKDDQTTDLAHEVSEMV